MHAHASPKMLQSILCVGYDIWIVLKGKLDAVLPGCLLLIAASQSNMLCFTQEISQPQRRQPPRRKAQQQFSLDSDSSDDNSPVEQEELSRGEEEDVRPELFRRPRSARVNRTTLLFMDCLSLSILVGLEGMHKTGCSGETRLVLLVPSSS